MGSHNIIVGRQGEEDAADYLMNLGFQVLQRNYRCRFGEIDIIALENNCLCFAEVKARTTVNYGIPEEAVDYRKRNKIRRVAEYYLCENRTDHNFNIRFDVVAVQYDGNKSIKTITLYRGAF